MSVQEIGREEVWEMIKAGVAMLVLAGWLWAGMFLAAMIEARPSKSSACQSGPAGRVLDPSILMAQGHPRVSGGVK